jgi:hypothetical protein
MHPQAARKSFLKIDGLRLTDDCVRKTLATLEAELGIASNAGHADAT